MVENHLYLNNTVNSSQELEIVDDFIGRIQQELKPGTYKIQKSERYDELFKSELIESVNLAEPDSAMSLIGGREMENLKDKDYLIARVDPRCVTGEKSDFYYYCLELCLEEDPRERWKTRIVLEQAYTEPVEISFLGRSNGYYYLVEKSQSSQARIWRIHKDQLAREYWAGTAKLSPC